MGKCKNLISCWWRAVCTLGERSEVRWRTGIHLALLILWCLRLSISRLHCLLWCHASLHLICIHSCAICLFWLLSGLQEYCVLGFSSLLPHCIIFPLSLFLPLLLVFPLLCEIVIAGSSIFTRCGQGPESFNLPNKLSASFSPIMCVYERNILFSLFWICVSSVTLKRFPRL